MKGTFCTPKSDPEKSRKSRERRPKKLWRERKSTPIPPPPPTPSTKIHIRSDEGLALETSAIVSFTAFHYPHQHTVDTPVCLSPRRRSQPSSLKSWHYTVIKFTFMEILLYSILEVFVTTDIRPSEDRLQEDFLKRLI